MFFYTLMTLNYSLTYVTFSSNEYIPPYSFMHKDMSPCMTDRWLGCSHSPNLQLNTVLTMERYLFTMGSSSYSFCRGTCSKGSTNDATTQPLSNSTSHGRTLVLNVIPHVAIWSSILMHCTCPPLSWLISPCLDWYHLHRKSNQLQPSLLHIWTSPKAVHHSPLRPTSFCMTPTPTRFSFSKSCSPISSLHLMDINANVSTSPFKSCTRVLCYSLEPSVNSFSYLPLCWSSAIIQFNQPWPQVSSHHTKCSNRF